MSWANSLGFSEVRSRLDALAGKEGERFEPAPLLANAANLKELEVRHA